MSQTKAQLLDGSVVSVAFGAGSAAAPSVYYSADTTTGLYFPGTGQVAISTNGSGRLFVDANGNIGVGTTPTNVATYKRIDIGVAGTSNGLLTLRSAGGAQEANIGCSSAGLGFTTNSYATPFDARASEIIFGTGSSGTERMRITSAGFLGLGTSSPAVKLDLANIHGINNTVTRPFALRNFGQISAAGYGVGMSFFYPNGTTSDLGFEAAAIDSSYTSGGNFGNLIFSTNNNTGVAERMRITSAGNVGIGTTSPASPFNVISSSTPAVILQNPVASNYTSLRLYNDQNSALRTLEIDYFGSTYSGGESGYIATTGAYPLTFGTNNIERARIDSSGNLLVGGTNNSLNARVVAENASGNQIASRYTGVATYYFNTTSSGDFEINKDGAGRLRIDSSGRLLVGTSSARSGFFSGAVGTALQIEGSTTATASLSITRNAVDADSSKLVLAHARGTANQILVNGDAIGEVTWQGADGTKLLQAASITALVDGTPGTDDMPGRLVFSTTADGSASPTEAVRINNGQNLMLTQSGSGIFVGTTSDGAFRIGRSSFAVSTGTLYIGNAAIQVSSDVRLKKDIEDTNLDALDAISRIRVKDFSWDDPTDTSHNNRNARGKWTGLIAQELVEVLPFVVNAPRKEEDGLINHDCESIWTLDQSQLCPVLIKAIQQQQAIIASLEARLTALEGA